MIVDRNGGAVVLGSVRALLMVLSCCGCLITSPARAQDLDFTTGASTGDVGMTSGGGGQTFTVPVGVNRVTSVTLGVRRTGGATVPYSLRLYRISGSTLGAVESSATNGIGNESMELDTLTLPGDGLIVAPGDTLAILGVNGGSNRLVPIRNTSPYGSGSAYAAGALQPGAEAFFAVTFGFVPPVQAVPTLSEWTTILLGLLLVGGALLVIQRRGQPA